MPYRSQSIKYSSKYFVSNRNSIMLDELKQIFESPKLVISDHFDKIRNDVDLESETLLLDRKLRNTYKKQQEISKNRETMIVKIKQFEAECLSQVNTVNTKECKEMIKALEAELSLPKSAEELEIITKLLEKEVHKLKSVLFLNKSFIFLKKQQVIDFNSDESVVFGKLIFMNYFFSSTGMEAFHEKLNHTNNSTTKELNNK